jgi:hypothetical protein
MYGFVLHERSASTIVRRSIPYNKTAQIVYLGFIWYAMSVTSQRSRRSEADADATQFC